MRTPKTRGRPSKFTAEIATTICTRLASGESLRSICRDSGMPSEPTVRRWAIENTQGFSAQYARAREFGYHSLFDSILEIADTPQMGVKAVEKADGTIERTTADMIEHRRLQVEARKWMIAKALPKVFGPRIDDFPAEMPETETVSLRDAARQIVHALHVAMQPGAISGAKPAPAPQATKH